MVDPLKVPLLLTNGRKLSNPAPDASNNIQSLILVTYIQLIYIPIYVNISNVTIYDTTIYTGISPLINYRIIVISIVNLYQRLSCVPLFSQMANNSPISLRASFSSFLPRASSLRPRPLILRRDILQKGTQVGQLLSKPSETTHYSSGYEGSTVYSTAMHVILYLEPLDGDTCVNNGVCQCYRYINL